MPHDLQNRLRLRMLRDQEILGTCQNFLEF